MPITKLLTEIERKSPKDRLGGLLSASRNDSITAAQQLIAEAKETGLCFSDYLKLSVDPTKAEKPAEYKDLNGLEATFAFLNLPFRNHLEQGVFLQAASDTFQKFPGTRAMFPEVIDQMLRWKNRQPNIEQLAPLLAQSRTIAGNEMISTVVEDDTQARGTFIIAELGKIPVRTIRTSQNSVTMYKHGSGIKTSYEFERRASLDILTPFAARVARELEISKVRAATNVIVNGDGVNAAAPVVAWTSFGGIALATTPLRQQYSALAKWMISRAVYGAPIDTLVGNLNIYLELLMLFQPTLAGQTSEIQAAIANGGPGINVNLPMLGGTANFALSTSLPDNYLIGMTKAETLEELIEAGSTISENERFIENQAVVYTRTENSGFKLAYSDTRSIVNFNA